MAELRISPPWKSGVGNLTFLAAVDFHEIPLTRSLCLVLVLAVDLKAHLTCTGYLLCCNSLLIPICMLDIYYTYL